MSYRNRDQTVYGKELWKPSMNTESQKLSAAAPHQPGSTGQLESQCQQEPSGTQGATRAPSVQSTFGLQSVITACPNNAQIS